MKISLYFAPSLIMEKSPACRVLWHPWHGKRSRKASVKTSHRSPGEGKEPRPSTVENREMLDVDTDTEIFNWSTGEYQVIAEGTTSDQLITSLALTRSAFMLPFSPQLVHDWKTDSLMRIKYLNVFFSIFCLFFGCSYTNSYLLSLSSLLLLVKGHSLWWISWHIFKGTKTHLSQRQTTKAFTEITGFNLVEHQQDPTAVMVLWHAQKSVPAREKNH